MADEGKKERSMKEIIADATDEQLDREPVRTISVEELKAMVARHDARVKRRRRKVSGIIALFFVVITGGAMAFSNFTTDADADKNGKEEILTEDGVVIEDSGWGSSSETTVITEWSDIKTIKFAIEELIVPEYIPDPYQFDNLTVEELENGSLMCVYSFKDNAKEQMEIQQFIGMTNNEAYKINGYDETVKTDKGKVYLQKEDEITIATMYIDGGSSVKIWGSIDDAELIKIINHLSS